MLDRVASSLPSALVAVVAAALGTSPVASPVAPPCPIGAMDPARAARVEALARATTDGREALDAAGPARICFDADVDARSVTIDADVVVLAARADDRALAARLAHLSLHRRDRALFAGTGGDCEAWVRAILAAEADAHEVEARVARDLRARPITAESVETLARDYRARCLSR